VKEQLRLESARVLDASGAARNNEAVSEWRGRRPLSPGTWLLLLVSCCSSSRTDDSAGGLSKDYCTTLETPVEGEACLPIGESCGWYEGCEATDLSCTVTGWTVRRGLNCFECGTGCDRDHRLPRQGEPCPCSNYDIGLGAGICNLSIATVCGEVALSASCTHDGWTVEVACPCGAATDAPGCDLNPRCTWNGSACVDT
jgi:hypothetical protein